jgi:hypothetical protein
VEVDGACGPRERRRRRDDARARPRAHLPAGIDDIVADGSTLYLSVHGDNTNGGLPSECVSSHGAFRASLGAGGSADPTPTMGFDPRPEPDDAMAVLGLRFVPAS